MNRLTLFFIIILLTLVLHGCSFNLNQLQTIDATYSYHLTDSESFAKSHIKNYFFSPYKSQKINFDQSQNSALFKIKIISPNIRKEDYVLVVDYKYLDKVSYFSEYSDGTFTQTRDLLRLKPSSSKIFSAEKYVFNVNNNASHHYIVIENHKDSIVMIKVVDKDKYIRFDRNMVTFFTILYSSLFGLFLINFIYYLFIKKTAYVYYSAYIFSGLLSIYWMEGSLIDIPFLTGFAIGYSMYLSVFIISNLFLYIFIYKFLQLDWKKQLCGKIILACIAYILLMLLALIVFHFTNSQFILLLSDWYNYTIQVGNIMILLVAYIIYKNGNRQAGFLLVSFLIFIVFSSMKILFLLDSEPNHFWMQHSYEIGLVIEAFILSLGLADQALGYKKSYDSAENKFIKANKALFAETLINNFRYEVKEEILKENRVENFIKHIESKFAEMIMKYAPIDNLKRLSLIDGVCQIHRFFQLSENGNFRAFFSANKESIQLSCGNGMIFSQVYKVLNSSYGIQFIVLPVSLSYNSDKVDNECLIIEIKPNYILNDEEIENLKGFIDKSLEALIASNEIKQITKHAQNIISVAAEKEKSMRMKDRFFANVSHEFRTPLTLTIAPLKDLHKQREFLNTSSKYLVDTALSNAMDLMSLVDKILDIQKLETDTFPLRVTKVNLNQLIYSIINKLVNWSLDHFQTLTFNKSSESDIYVYCDIKEVKKVIINLITNAIKYSGQHSEITVSVEECSTWIKIHITDDGVGIDKDIQEYIFERYYQGNTSYHLSEAGTGIGLSYVKDVMELHQGNVTLISKVERGSQFTLWFKQGFRHFDYDEISGSKEKSILQDKDNSIDVDKENNAADLIDKEDITTLLIVEDNRELRKFLTYKFKNVYKVIEADNGVNGLQKANCFLPDIIISDVMMPKMDGIEMIKHIRNTTELATIPIILLTAKSSNIDTIEGLQTGADDYMSKPFDFDELMARVDRLITARKAITDKNYSLTMIPEENIKSEFQERLDEAIVANIADKKLNVEKLAKILFIDRSTLYRKIKNKLEMTPIAYIRKVRMELALNLLKNKKLTVSETAYACGFDSLSYFSKQFKKTHGTSPSDVL